MNYYASFFTLVIFIVVFMNQIFILSMYLNIDLRKEFPYVLKFFSDYFDAKLF